ncbi:hypothetical protein [Chryseoglobus sp. 28M-23]|uniref:hypothetical protein n=1 Tax=Chryseoglobus sp. 28M-23 TaxID=2772253 RepID=UPI0017461C0E|nr:hypothetical protein [Chryseoglobus sp. 28M-23]QOD93472.1 hypothetical protein IE160_11295 [Chryseoglobus sp. 28M-23]
MSALDEFQALTQSIGEYAADLIGRESLAGLRVTFDRRNRSGQISIALNAPSGDEQLRVISCMFEVEQVFKDEAILSYSFVDGIGDEVEARETIRQYSLA